MRGITEDELALLNHVCRWGSDGYPVQKIGRGWHVMDWRAVKAAPVVQVVSDSHRAEPRRLPRQLQPED